MKLKFFVAVIDQQLFEAATEYISSVSKLNMKRLGAPVGLERLKPKYVKHGDGHIRRRASTLQEM
jgi:hypothetical protein